MQENVTGGSAPTLNITVDPTTNRINMAGFSYDAAGNLTHTPDGKTYAYDSENRTSQGNEGTYFYGANGRRLASVSSGTNGTWYFHGPGGIEVSLISAPSTAGCGQYYSGLQSGFCVQGSAQEKLYFAGRLVLQGDASNSTSPGGLATVTDRLGSVVQTDGNVASIMDYVYYPYGGVPSGLMPNQVTFATYEAAGTSMLYAQNRYYDPARGRFTSPDKKRGSIGNPLSWNKYSYVLGDPINYNDPLGLCSVMIGGITMSSDSSSAFNQMAGALGAAMAFPYSGQSGNGSVASVIGQASGTNSSTQVARNAILGTLANNSGSIDIVAYSGGAAAFTAAYGQLTAAQQSRIGSILYISPGAAGSVAAIQGATSVVLGSGVYDTLATSGTVIPAGTPITGSGCDHQDMACLFAAAQAQIAAIQRRGACSNPQTFSLSPGSTLGVGSPVRATPPDYGWTGSNPWSLIDWIGAIPVGGGGGGGGIPSVNSSISYEMDDL